MEKVVAIMKSSDKEKFLELNKGIGEMLSFDSRYELAFISFEDNVEEPLSFIKLSEYIDKKFI